MAVRALEKIETQKYKGFLPLKLALFVVACAALVLLFSWQMRIEAKRVELQELQTAIVDQDARNDEIRKTVDSLENDEGLSEYAQQRAREDLDYAKPGERIFVDVGGGD